MWEKVGEEVKKNMWRTETNNNGTKRNAKKRNEKKRKEMKGKEGRERTREKRRNEERREQNRTLKNTWEYLILNYWNGMREESIYLRSFLLYIFLGRKFRFFCRCNLWNDENVNIHCYLKFILFIRQRTRQNWKNWRTNWQERERVNYDQW